MGRAAIDEGPHPVDRIVGKRVCSRRISLGYNQSDLAKALGITFQQVQKYEKGSNRISASKLWDISIFLQVDIGYFFGDLGASDASRRVSSTDLVDSQFPATRHSIEISRLAPQLSLRQQKLASALLKSMIERAPSDES